MRISTLALLLPALLLNSPVQAGGADPYFNSATGKVVIPRVQIGDKLYYAELIMTDSKTLSFIVNLGNLLDVTPAPGFVAPAASSLVGSWIPQSSHVIQIDFNPDGTYSFSQTDTADDKCGGSGPLETGTYNWDASTGIFVAHVLTDQNAECGFSKDQGIRQFLVSGANRIFRGIADHKVQDITLVPK